MKPELTNDGRGGSVDTAGDGAARFEVEGREEVKPMCPCEG